MNQNKFYTIDHLNKLDFCKLDYKLNILLNLDNINILSLFKFVLNKKKFDLKIKLKISGIGKFDKNILIKLLSINVIEHILVDIGKGIDIEEFLSLILILGKFNNLKVSYNFYFGLVDSNFILFVFEEKLYFGNIDKILLDFTEVNNLFFHLYILDKILSIFQNNKFINYSIRGIPKCFLLGQLKKFDKGGELKVGKNLNKNCLKCKILNKCGGASDNLKVFPIRFSIEEIDLYILEKLSKSVVLSNIYNDIENKYPINSTLIKDSFVGTSKDFFRIINSSPKDISLYIHIPFCASKCNFCCCNSQEGASLKEKNNYLKKLLDEIKLFGKKLKNKKIKNIFFGGGTPSFYSEKELSLIFLELRKYFNLINVNIAFEVTESTITEKKIDFLKEMGVTNIYMGLQTGDEGLLKNINRIQNIDRFIKLSKYIKNKGINFSVDIIVGLRGDTLDKLKNTVKIIEEVLPNSLQVCRFELFGNIKGNYKNYIPKHIEEHFCFVKDRLLRLGYKQLDIYDEIFYLDKTKMSNYEQDIIMGKTDLIGLGAFAKSKIIDKLEWENKGTKEYISYNDVLFLNKKFINLLKNGDNGRHYIVSNLDSNNYKEDYLNSFIDFDVIKNKTNFFIKLFDGYKLNNIYNTRFLSKIIGGLFFEDNYLEDIYKQELFNLYIENNLEFYKYLGAKLDNYDNVYPIDPILNKITEEEKYLLWKSYLRENINNKKVFHIDKLGIYIHIPFCSTICSFCSCKTNTDLERIDEYLGALVKEIEKYGKIFKGYTFKTIYFGGGTPGILNNNQLTILFEALYKNFNLSKDIYISFEATPYSLNKEKLQLLKKFGVTRLSIGLQSLDKDVLKNINRPQSINYLYKLFKIIKEVGIEYVNVDFVAGLKGETLKTVNKMLDFVKDIKPDSIHLYQYYVDRSNSNENYDKERIDEIEKIFYFIKKRFLDIGYSLSDNHDSVFLLNPKTISNLHDYNVYKFNNSVLALGEYSEGHIFGKLYYKNIKNGLIKGKKVTYKDEFGIYLMKNLEFGIDILEFKNIFNCDILDLFKNELSYLLSKNYIYIENNVIKTKINKHLDYISLYKIFWPKKELFKFYVKYLTRKKDKINYNLLNTKPIK